MEKVIHQNRVCNVISRYSELMGLLKDLKCDDEKFEHIVDLVTQSHSNEIELLTKLRKYEFKDKSDIDIPEFMK